MTALRVTDVILCLWKIVIKGNMLNLKFLCFVEGSVDTIVLDS